MKALDIPLLLLLLYGGYSGYRKGLLLEAFSLIAFVAALFLSTRLLDATTEWCAAWQTTRGPWLPYAAFVLLFVSLVIGITILGRLIKRLIRPTVLGTVDCVAGALLGILKWGTLASTIIWFSHIPEEYTQDTILFPIIRAWVPWLLSWCPSSWSGYKSLMTRMGF